MSRSRYFSSSYSESGWAPYVPVAERRRQAGKAVSALQKKGRVITPIEISGRTIASTFWGKSWCSHLETFSDYATRLPRGRTYVRNGSVVHLEVAEGRVEALVQGSSLYTVKVEIASLSAARWSAVAAECSGKIESLVELLAGKLSKGVMDVVTHKERGLFPSPKEITLACSCPDWAMMCKHVAAVMYGVGARLDVKPELLFRLRGVDHAALFTKVVVARATTSPKVPGKVLDADRLAGVFGIEMDEGEETPAPVAGSPAPASRAPRSPARGRDAQMRSPAPPAAVAPPAPSPVARRRAPPATARVTLLELAACGVRIGDVHRWLDTGELVATSARGTYETTPAIRKRLLSRGAPG